MKVKIVLIDNYNRRIFNDVLIAKNLHEGQGEAITKELNKLNTDDNVIYYLANEGYKLFKVEKET